MAATKIKDVTADGLTTAIGPGPMEVGLVSSPAQHFQQSERLLAAVKESLETALLAAIVHALLAQAPRCARRVERHARHSGNGIPPQLTWGDKQ